VANETKSELIKMICAKPRGGFNKVRAQREWKDKVRRRHRQDMCVEFNIVKIVTQ